MACINKLSGDILFDCNDTPKKGIAGSRAVLVNYEDVDFGATTTSGATTSNFVLKAGATGYKLEWYKELASAGGTYTPNAEEIDGFAHSFLGRLTTSSANNAERARELKEGRFVVIYESKYQGVGQKEAYKILGLESGLELSEMNTSTNENSGSILFTLSTKESDYEQYPFGVLLNVDYATTSADVEALFAGL